MIDYHWTPVLQRRFLEALAETGSVSEACDEVKMSRRAAYNLRHKRAGLAFGLGWEAAVLIARAAIADTLMDRALHGHTEYSVRDPQTGKTERFRKDGRLGLTLLTRLDRMADRDMTASRNQLPWIVSGDFEAFLDIVGGTAREQDIAAYFLARLPEDSPFRCELMQISAALSAEDDHDDEYDEEEDREDSEEDSGQGDPAPEPDEIWHDAAAPGWGAAPVEPLPVSEMPEAEPEPEREAEAPSGPRIRDPGANPFYPLPINGPRPGEKGYPPQWLIDLNRNGFR